MSFPIRKAEEGARLEFLSEELQSHMELLRRRRHDEFIDNPSKKPDYKFWARLDQWTFDEALALSFGADPDSPACTWINRLLSLAMYELDDSIRAKASELCNKVGQRVELLTRAIASGRLTSPMSPWAFVTFAREKEFALVPELEALVQLANPCAVNLKREFEGAMSDLADREAEIAVLKNENEGLRQKLAGSANVKIHDSLLRVILGMATIGYKYDGAAPRNSAVADIAGDCHQIGCKIDEDTVRKILRKAYERFGSGQL